MRKGRFLTLFICVVSLVAIFLVSVKMGDDLKNDPVKRENSVVFESNPSVSHLAKEVKIDLKKITVSKELEEYLEKSKVKWEDKDEEDVVETLLYIENKFGYQPLLFLKLMKVESNFKLNAVSPDGAIGLCQIQPQTAKEISLKMGSPQIPRSVLFDPVINLKLSAYYLNYLETKYKSLPKALNVYNMGPKKYFEVYGESSFLQGSYHKKISDN